MSNPARNCEPNQTYHTYSRCISKFSLMKQTQMKELMIKVLKMALEKYKFELINYVIMDNHFHFFIRTVKGGATISRIMQFIKSQYAVRYNKRVQRSGPFWNERFKDKIVEAQEDPVEAFHNMNIYIICNPVKSYYVSDARKYEYGCIHFFLDKKYKPPVKLTYHKYYLKLGRTFNARKKKFLKLEEKYLRKEGLI